MYKLTKSHIAAFVTAMLAVIVVLAVAMPAFAYEQRPSRNEGGISVSVSNSASVTNVVHTSATTGGNDANGGDGEEGGNGGDAEGTGDNTGGNGGNGGSGALGGLIHTGDATAYTSILNDVNSTDVDVKDSCGCENDRPRSWGWGWGQDSQDQTSPITVSVRNDRTSVKNEVDTKAKTGYNTANGGDGEEGGNGGDAENEGSRNVRTSHYFSFWMPTHNDNKGGNGGTGGTGGVGGEIYTGKATSGTEVVNVVNRTVTRVTR